MGDWPGLDISGQSRFARANATSPTAIAALKVCVALIGGPCPPIGRHRYFHKLYALDITLDLRNTTKLQIERAMRDHVLANAELIGTYQKGDR